MVITPPANGQPYGRTLLRSDDDGEMLLMSWRPGAFCAPHDHGGAEGVIHLIEGRFIERQYIFEEQELRLVSSREISAPAILNVAKEDIHAVCCLDAGLSLHRYHPQIRGMRVHDLETRSSVVVDDDHGAWLPEAPMMEQRREAWSTPSTESSNDL